MGFLTLLAFHFHQLKILNSNLLTFLQELAVSVWQCKTLAENVFSQVNGIKKLNELTKLILEKDLLATSQKRKQNPLFQTVSTCFVQVFLVKRFLLLENVEDLKIQEERCFLTLRKLSNVKNRKQYF